MSTEGTVDKKFDVFLSHNSKDKPDVRTLGKALRERGLSVWLDEWELPPGSTWVSKLDDIVRDCRTALVCFGSSGIGPWQQPEMESLLITFIEQRKEGEIKPIIPVLLPGAKDIQLPVLFKAFTWVDLRNGLTEEGLKALNWGITGEKPRENAPAVCLAKVTPDLRDARETIAKYLTNARINVLPAKPYSSDATQFLTSLEADLAQADVFVQILGSYPADRPDELPEGEELTQLQKARSARKPILQWRDKAVDLAAISDPAHRALVGGADVVCNDRAEFARMVAERAQSAFDLRHSGGTDSRKWLALINADKSDQNVADEVITTLRDANVNCRFPRTSKSLMDRLREAPYDALLIVYGACSDDWLDRCGDELMAVELNLKDSAPVWAYYLCTEDVRLPYQSKGMLQVKHRDKVGWQRLMQAIQKRGGRP